MSASRRRSSLTLRRQHRLANVVRFSRTGQRWPVAQHTITHTTEVHVMSRLAQRPERNNVTIIIGAQVEVHKFFEYDDAQAFYECMLVHLVETCAEYWIDFDGYYRDVRDGAVHRSGRIGEVAA